MGLRDQMTTQKPAKHPHLFWTMTEWRALFEYASFGVLRRALKRLPAGDGHPVLVIPGFMAGDSSTRPMRKFLKDLEYDAHGWGLGLNLRVTREREERMIARTNCKTNFAQIHQFRS